MPKIFYGNSGRNNCKDSYDTTQEGYMLGPHDKRNSLVSDRMM